MNLLSTLAKFSDSNNSEEYEKFRYYQNTIRSLIFDENLDVYNDGWDRYLHEVVDFAMLAYLLDTTLWMILPNILSTSNMSFYPIHPKRGVFSPNTVRRTRTTFRTTTQVLLRNRQNITTKMKTTHDCTRIVILQQK